MSVASISNLVGEREASEDIADVQQYLSFRCTGERYALPIRQVREIIEYDQLTPVPMMPAFIRGVINLRGKVVPVVDLACRFGLGETARARRTCVIILELDDEGYDRQMGLVVESVEAVFDLEANEVEPAPRFGAGIRADFIAGMARDEQGFLILLDLGRVLSVSDMKLIAEAQMAGDRSLVDVGHS